jgi:hypothetical protein
MVDKLLINETVKKLFKTLDTDQNFILIYTPPKVGSTTLVSSLRVSLGRSYNIIHIHDEVMLNVLTGIKNITINQIIHYLSELGKNVFVIDVYRTPVERKMSEFFEKLSSYHFNNTEENISNYNLDRIIDRFNNIYPHIENSDHYFENYNIESPPPFDFDKKYTIQQTKPNLTYVKLRLCDSNNWGTILSTILNQDIVIINDYHTKNKLVGDLYKRFKEKYRLPINYFEELKTNKYLNYYYNEEERNHYLNEWKCKIGKPVIPYTSSEYIFYVNLYLENQYINDIQVEHYIDNGCFCKYCTFKRKEIFIKAKKGETQFEKIIHNEVILEYKKKVLNKITTINYKKKFEPNQFSIKQL